MSFRAKITGLVACAALAPLAAALGILVRTGPDPAALLACAAAAGLSLAAAAKARSLIRPLAEAADRLRAGESERGSGSPGDDVSVLLSGIEQMRDKIASLQHRWSQRHPLTDLPTRELLLAEMERDIEQSDRETMLGVIRFRDFDRLSAFDPNTAEIALKAFAAVLAEAVGSKRPLAQIDRDSFAIWFRGSSRADAKTELRALCYALGRQIFAGELPLVPEIEAGAGIFPDDGTDAAAIITRTLLSLDSAGTGSGGTVELLAPKPAHAERERFSLEQGLRQAISREQFELHFQPVVDVGQRKLVGAEALIRWHHPEAGLLSPSHFIPILEDTHLTEEIGMWTLNAACRAARSWRTHGIEGLTIAVNLSATQLKNPNLVQMIGRTLERHRLPPKALELELTETAATEDAERTFRLFSQLRSMGVSLAIDDFGSGYSSLSYVKNLPFDKLKIDREFVIDVDKRPDSQAICRTVIELARGLGIRVLAEGVERANEVSLLQRFGCTLFQGFYFSEPLIESEFVEIACDRDWPGALAEPAWDATDTSINRMIA